MPSFTVSETPFPSFYYNMFYLVSLMSTAKDNVLHLAFVSNAIFYIKLRNFEEAGVTKLHDPI